MVIHQIVFCGDWSNGQWPLVTLPGYFLFYANPRSSRYPKVLQIVWIPFHLLYVRMT
jgi:hypothetical protein